jgi:hypothetical protein
MTPETVAILLSQPLLRRVFSAVALGASTSSEILATSGLGAPEAAPAIGQLTREGLLISQGRGRLAVHEENLAAAARTGELQLAQRAAAEQPDPLLRGFIRNGTVVELPEHGEPRANVLGHIARTTYVPGEEYDERTATDRLVPWCEHSSLDVASLRRFLVDDGFLRRDAGQYRLTDTVRA